MINKDVLSAALYRLGPAHVFIGNPLVSSAMASIGILEGDRAGEIEYADNDFTMPEHTGDVPHDSITNVRRAAITGTLVLNTRGAAVWPKINPLGSNAGGSSNFKRVNTTSVLLIPERELGASLLYSAGSARWERTEDDASAVVGASAAPIHALWLWKARVKHGSIPYGFENGGRSMVDFTFEGMFDTTKPEGAKVFLIGDPRAFSTPIAVIL